MNKLLSTFVLGLSIAIAAPAFAEEHHGHEGEHQGHQEFHGERHFEFHSRSYEGGHEGRHDEGHWDGHGRRWSSRHWESNHWVYVYPDAIVPYVGMIDPDNDSLIWACGPYGRCGWVARY